MNSLAIAPDTGDRLAEHIRPDATVASLSGWRLWRSWSGTRLVTPDVTAIPLTRDAGIPPPGEPTAPATGATFLKCSLICSRSRRVPNNYPCPAMISKDIGHSALTCHKPANTQGGIKSLWTHAKDRALVRQTPTVDFA